MFKTLSRVFREQVMKNFVTCGLTRKFLSFTLADEQKEFRLSKSKHPEFI